MKYYYKLCVFEPYDYTDNIIIAHNKRYTNFELSSIVQEVIDSLVEDYAGQDEYDHNRPCNLELNLEYDNWGCYPNGFLSSIISRLKFDYDFELVIPIESIDIEKTRLFNHGYNDDKPAYLYERYKDLVLGECSDCYHMNSTFFEGCPVNNERRKS